MCLELRLGGCGARFRNLSTKKIWVGRPELKRIVFRQFRTISDQFRTVFGPFRTVSDGFGSFSNRFGPFRSVFGPFRTVFGLFWDRFRTDSERFGRLWCAFGPFSDDSTQNFKISNFNWPGLGLGHAVPSVRAVPPSPGQLKFEILRKNWKKTQRKRKRNRIFVSQSYGDVVM